METCQNEFFAALDEVNVWERSGTYRDVLLAMPGLFNVSERRLGTSQNEVFAVADLVSMQVSSAHDVVEPRGRANSKGS